jgi:hypothetical protein
LRLISTGTAVANENYDVFISYSRLDSRHATEIDSILRAKGLKSFFDRRNLSPGLPWARALEQAIGAAKAVIVLIGPLGLGNTQQYERELAFVRQSREPTFPVVPVILPGASTDLPFNFLQVLTWIDFSHVTKVSDAPLELQHLLTAVRGEPVSGEVEHEAIYPYRGLDAFREEDSGVFLRPRQRRRSEQLHRRTGAQGSRAAVRDGGRSIRQRQILARRTDDRGQIAFGRSGSVSLW